ncbi:MAG: histidine kinase N-terminal 7TM domain-containing protein, partial [Saccharofermentanales bacterium]
MDFETILLSFVVNVIPVISAVYVVAGVRLFKQKGEDEANYFALLMFAAAIYSFGYYLELISPSMELMLIFRNFEYFGAVFIPSLGLLFIAQFAERRTSGVLKALVLMVSAVIWILFLTNPLHGMFYSSIDFYRGRYSVPMTVKGPVYYILLAYVGVFLIYSNIILVKALKAGGTRNRRKSVRFVLITMMLPWAAMANILSGFNTYIDIAPATLVVVNGFFLINEAKNDMFTRRIKAKDRLLYVITAVTQGFLETRDFMKVIPGAFRQ